MIKEKQNLIYSKIASKLTEAMTSKNLSISALRKLSGEQRNTIIGILEGKTFSFHQALWLKEVIGIDLMEILTAVNMEFKVNGSIKKEASKKENSKRKIEEKSFSQASDFI